MMKQTIKTLFALLALLVSSTGALAWEGSGSSSNPYLIKTIDDMTQLATDVNSGTDNYNSKYFRLENDLTYTGSANNYTPIGKEGYNFCGYFDGNGKTIKGIRYTYTGDDAAYIGLFGYTSYADIKNLTLDDCWFQKTGASSGNIAVVVGYGSGTPVDKVIVKNCKAIAKNGNAAGIVSYAYYGVTNCVVENTEIAVIDGTTLNGLAGGIVAYENGGQVTDCVVTNCTIQACHAGGICGDAFSGTIKSNHVENCTITGGESAGGISSIANALTHGCSHTGNTAAGNTTITVPTGNAAGALFAQKGYNAWTNNYYAQEVKVIIGSTTYDGTTARGYYRTTGTPAPDNYDGISSGTFRHVNLVAYPVAGGTVSAGRTWCLDGKSMTTTVTATPNAGYRLANWESTDIAITDPTATSFTFTKTMTADITITGNFVNGLQLKHTFGTNATVTFWNGGTSEPTSVNFEPTTYTDANKITEIDNAGDTEDRYIIVHIEPSASYWTDQQLLMAMETGASLAPSKAPGLDLGQALKLLKADDGHHDGAGWYYYTLSKDHKSPTYTTSTIDGFVVPKFDLNTATLSTSTASTSEVTLTANATGNWQTIIKINKTSFEYNGQNQTSTFSNAGNKIVVTKDGTTAAEFTIGDYLEFKIKDTGTDPATLVPSMKNAANYTGVVGTFANTIFTNSKDVPFAITPKAVTLTSGNKSREYNGSALTNAEVEGKNANGLTVETGWIDGEGATYSFTGTQTTVGNSANAFTYTLKTGTLASNYSITKTEGTLTVTQNTTAITVTPGSGSKTYDGTPLTKTAHEDFAVTGVPAGFTWTATADGTVTNVTPGAGEKAVNAVTSFKIFKNETDVTNQFSGINTSATGTLTITAKTLTITADSETKIYDGTALTKNSYTNTALAAGDAIASVTITGSQTNVGSSNNVPSAAIIKNAGNANVTANYNITYVNGTLTVNTKRVNDSNIADDKDTDIIIEQNSSATASASYTYNGSEQKPTITVKDGTTVIPEGEYTISYKDANGNAVENPTNAGTYTVVITDNAGGNYEVSGETTFTITKKALTITADNASKLYDGTALTKNSYTHTELATGDAIKSVTITGSQTAVGSSNNVPSAAVIKNGSDADVTANYDITYVNGTLEVTKKTVKDNPNTGTGESQVSIVLANIPAEGYTYDGTAKTPAVTVKDGDNEIPSTEYTVTITNNTNAGTATVTITDNDGGNYTVSGTTTFAIKKATLTITANNQEKEVGADDPALTYTYEGLAAGDAISGALTRAAGEAVGSYAINQGTLSAGNNYTIDYTGAQLTIYRTLSLFSGSNEWATYVAQENLAVPAGIKAYIVTSVNGNTIITKNISYIPANVPILLQRTDNTVGDVKAVAGTGTDDVSGNKLVGNATAATDIQTYKDYVLYNNQFVLAGVSSVGAGKAYLPATAISSPAGAPRYLTICYGETMGINSLTPTLSEGEGAWYTLDGHKLNGKPAKKGLYIKNGVKVVIK